MTYKLQQLQLIHEISELWLTNDAGTAGRPWEEELLRQLSYTANFDMLDMHIVVKSVWSNVLEVHEVHEVQEIPNQIKKYILGEVIACQ